MPFENERKYVLDISLSEAALGSWERQDIRQAYLAGGARIRQANGDFLFTYKRWIEARKDHLEIETDIAEEDFRTLWECAERRLTKTRYVRQETGAEWVVDFFKADGKTYFVMAEVEMPATLDNPETMPVVVRDHLTFAVPHGDERFSSANLYDVAFASGLLKQICR